MKYNILYAITVLAFLVSCIETKAEPAKENTVETITPKKDKEAKSVLKSNLRPNENIKINEEYQDEVVFIKTDDNGDYPLLLVAKKGKSISLIFSDTETNNFSKTTSYEQGDVIRIKWKLDTAEMAGDGDKPYLTEFLISSKKVKDGKLSLFNKAHPNPFRVQHIDADFSSEFLKNIDQKVRYYLANTKEPLLLSELKDPNSNLMYSIEDQEKDGKKYTAIALITTFENHQNTLHWLYIDNATDELYDYDLPNDRLIKLN